jgi:UDP-3-O-[3-hydroxymyristoyl] glucosamine N-acyltransferase
MEGQNYAQTADGWIDLPSAGSVTIADDVHVGAYATIVRGTAGNTTLHKGCRIGHHVNIGHDCRIGEHTLVIAHASLAGWVRVGRWCKIYQRACVKNGVTIGDGAIIGMGAVVTKDVGAGEIWAGNPARKIGYVRP